MSSSPTIERAKAGRIIVTLTPSPDEVSKAQETALRTLGAQTEIKGFRVGNAPLDKIRERVSNDQLMEETTRVILRDVLPAVIAEQKITPIIPPKVEIASVEPFSIRMILVERPEVTIKKIDTFSIPKKEVKLDPKDVEKVIDSVLREHRTLQSVDRASESGDQVTITFSAKDMNGADVPSLSADNYEVTIGGSNLIPGFEEQLIGLKKGETKTFTLTLPEKFPMDELKGKSAVFTVNVLNIDAVTLPPLTDELAKEKLGAENAAGFRSMVEMSMKMQEEQYDRMRQERELMEEIRKRTDVELAPELLDQEVDSILVEWNEQLQAKGKTIADYMQQEKKTPEDIRKDLQLQAEERWKLRLGMAKLIEHKNITVTDEEVQAAFTDYLASLSPDERPQAESSWKDKGPLFEELRWRTMVQKVTEIVLA